MVKGSKSGGFGDLAKGALRAAALAGVSGLAMAQSAWADASMNANEVSGVTVEADRSTGIGRLPQPIEELPQTVHVIDERILQQQAVVSLDQAVRNIPGITANTGEGGGAVAGDQFRIRGFDAANDIATDGLRDFGVYTRDTFNTESVQVFLGPTGATFGRGSFGGAINTTSKFAKLEDSATIQGALGTAEFARFVADVNHELGETSALRLNVMAHHNALADIDDVTSDRFGFAAAAGWGIGADTSFDLMYFHQTDNRIPYYGVPVSTFPDGIGRPLPVDRSNFYGTSEDHDESDADVLTARLSHKFSESLTLKNDTRVGVFSRDFQVVAPGCNAACLAGVLAGNTSVQATRGAPTGPYHLEQWGVQNITTAIADFDWGGFTHQFVAGFDATYETAQRENTSAWIGADGIYSPRPTTSALNPSPTWNGAEYIAINVRESESTTYAVFASEQIWLTEQFSLLASVRWDEYEAESTLHTRGTVDSATGAFTAAPATAPLEISETLFSPRVSAVWEPGENTIFYLSWAQSEQPATGTALASVGTPISGTQTDLEPTASETLEAGARFPLFSPDVILSLSVFQIERDNAKTFNPDGSIASSGDAQEAQGFEVSLSGEITDRWTANLSYTYLDTETTLATAACVATIGSPLQCPTGVPVGGAVPNPAAIGNPIPFAAEHAATLWTTYEATDKLLFGFGARYTDEIWLNNTNTAIGPEYISYDALVQYFFEDGLTLQLNGTNLADREDNFDQIVNGRAARAPGRAFVVSLTKNF